MIWAKARRTEKASPDALLPALTLQGPRLYARPPRVDDARLWAAVRGRDRSFLKPYEPHWPEDCLSPDFFGRRLARQTREWHEDRAYAFLLFGRRDDTLLGGVNINNVCRGAAQYASLGYWLARDQQGHGYMREALTMIVDFGFRKLKLHRFNAACLPDNERSRRLLLRLGFTEEGFAARYVQIDGRWQDHRLFGLNVEDWMTASPRDSSGAQDNRPS